MAESRTFWTFAEPSAEQARKLDAIDEANALVARGFTMLEGLRPVGGILHADRDGRLWRREPGDPMGGRKPEQYAFAPADDWTPVWFIVPEQGPKTLEELEALQAEQAKEAAKLERKRQAELKRLRALAIPVTFDHFEVGQGLTLRDAGERVTNAGGKLEVKDGRLVVLLPPAALVGFGNTLSAAERLYRAEPVVLEALEAKAELPDRAVLPSGALAP